MTKPFFAGWREQYDRMLRSYERLQDQSSGKARADSNESRDSLIRFFQDALHLRDWIYNDESTPAAARDTVRQDVKHDSWLALAGDLANGAKHLLLDPNRRHLTGDHRTGFASQSVTLHLGASEYGTKLVTRWTVTSNGVVYDALEVARQAVSAWTVWLHQRGLLT